LAGDLRPARAGGHEISAPLLPTCRSFISGVAANAFDHQSATVRTITTSLVWKFGAY